MEDKGESFRRAREERVLPSQSNSLAPQKQSLKTELAAGDYIYIPLMDALFIVENAPDDTHVNVIQVAGIKTAATPTFVPITPSADTKLDFKILKKGNVFRVERDLGIKRMDGTPQIAHDLIVDNRGIVNIGGGIAPPARATSRCT